MPTVPVTPPDWALGFHEPRAAEDLPGALEPGLTPASPPHGYTGPARRMPPKGSVPRVHIRGGRLPDLPVESEALAELLLTLEGSVPSDTFDGWLHHPDLDVRLALLANAGIRRTGSGAEGTSAHCYIACYVRAHRSGHYWTTELQTLSLSRVWPGATAVARSGAMIGVYGVPSLNPLDLIRPLGPWIEGQRTLSAVEPFFTAGGMLRRHTVDHWPGDDPGVVDLLSDDIDSLWRLVNGNGEGAPRTRDRAAQWALARLGASELGGEHAEAQSLVRLLHACLTASWRPSAEARGALEAQYWAVVSARSVVTDPKRRTADAAPLVSSLLVRGEFGGDPDLVRRLAKRPEAVSSGWGSLLGHPACPRELIVNQLGAVTHHATFTAIAARAEFDQDAEVDDLLVTHAPTSALVLLTRTGTGDRTRRTMERLVAQDPIRAVEALDALDAERSRLLPASLLAPLLHSPRQELRSRVLFALGRVDGAPEATERAGEAVRRPGMPR